MSLQHAELTPGFKTGHVGLNVSDLQRSLDFYQQVFGFRLLRQSTEPGRQFAFLGTDSGPVLTLWQQSQHGFDRGRPGLHHLSFEVAGPDQLQDVEARLRSQGTRLLYDGIVPHAEGSASGAVFFEDPDGIRLEVYSPSGAQAATTEAPHGPACGFF